MSSWTDIVYFQALTKQFQKYSSTSHPKQSPQNICSSPLARLSDKKQLLQTHCYNQLANVGGQTSFCSPMYHTTPIGQYIHWRGLYNPNKACEPSIPAIIQAQQYLERGNRKRQGHICAPSLLIYLSPAKIFM